MISIFLFVALLGYLAVILEAPIRINKTITAILTGALCWVVLAVFNEGNPHEVSEKLIAYFGEISGLLIFLLGAMTIVELIDLHKGFTVITHRIRTKSVLKLLWIVGIVTFILSALLDNLATAIIMITHDLGGLRIIKENMLVMYAGRTMEYGSAEQIFYNPTHLFLTY